MRVLVASHPLLCPKDSPAGQVPRWLPIQGLPSNTLMDNPKGKIEVRGVLVGPRGTVAEDVTWATSFRTRGRGVLGRPALRSDEAVVLVPCRRVHSVGVSYPLDVVFCDEAWVVLHVETLAPRRLSRKVPRARACIELAGGRASACGIVPGAQLSFEERP